VEFLTEIQTRHRGRTVRHFRVFLCHEFGAGPDFLPPPEPQP
jgi:hypothetical protein